MGHRLWKAKVIQCLPEFFQKLTYIIEGTVDCFWDVASVVDREVLTEIKVESIPQSAWAIDAFIRQEMDK